jgi:hypothetical protein
VPESLDSRRGRRTKRGQERRVSGKEKMEGERRGDSRSEAEESFIYPQLSMSLYYQATAVALFSLENLPHKNRLDKLPPSDGQRRGEQEIDRVGSRNGGNERMKGLCGAMSPSQQE